MVPPPSNLHAAASNRTSHSHWPSEHISFITIMRLRILQLSCRLFFFLQNIASPRSVSPPPHSPDLTPCDLRVFPKPKIAVVREEIYECDSHTVHKLSHCRLTAVWLAPRDSDCSRMRSEVSSDRLPYYIKATRPVFRDIQNGLILSVHSSYFQITSVCECNEGMCGSDCAPDEIGCMSRALYLRSPLSRRQGGPQCLSGRLVEERNFCYPASS